MHVNPRIARRREILGGVCVVLLGSSVVFGCGSSPSAENAGQGGSNGQGGALATGGASASAGSSEKGGATANGGSSANAMTGGSSADPSGGSNSATGGRAAGGSSSAATGGKSVGGASTSTGGKANGGSSAAATGGKGVGGSSSATGGKANGGSSAATGGKASGGSGTAGGGKASGGSSAAAGGKASGGSSAATGGSTGSGSCTFTVDAQLASAVKTNSPGTIGIVKWSVSGATASEANIEFGLDTSYGMTAPVDLTVANYQTPLLGMKPSKTYHYRIVATTASGTCTSQDYTLQTGAKTTSVSISSFSVKNEAARKRGFIVASYWQGTGSALPFIIDPDGEIVWWYAGGPSGGIARARMSADAKNMWMVVPALGSGGPVQRVSMDTLDPQTYSSTKASHDITAVSGSLMAYLDYSTTCNGITEIDPSGTTKKVFDANGVVPSSGCHSNALRYSKTEDVYTYSDLQSDVYVISRAGSVQWRLSQKVSGGNSSWGGKQHGHQLTDTSILIFANNGGGNNASTVSEYTTAGQLIKEFTSGGYTANLGDVQRLPGGNTLITYSNGKLIQELDPQGTVVLEINSGGASFGYTEWRESLYGPPQDIAQ